MSIDDNLTSEVQYTTTARSHPAPACMNYPGAGCFRLIRLSLFEPHEGPTRGQEHQHPVYHLVLFTDGPNEYRLGGRKVQSVRGSCALTAPGESHCFPPRKPGLTHYHAITFTFDTLTPPPSWAALLTHYTGLTPGLVPATFRISETALLKLVPLLHLLRESVTAPGPIASRQIHFGILQFFAVIAESLLEQQQAPSARDRTPEVGARDYLDIHYARHDGLAAVAAQAGVGAAHLSRAFKRRFGIAPGRYRDQLRMDAAKSLLHHSDLRIKEIASQLGYPDAYTFSKAFSRHCESSPRAYRDGLLRSR